MRGSAQGRERRAVGWGEGATTTAEYAMVLGGIALLVAAVFAVAPAWMRVVWARADCLLAQRCGGGDTPVVAPWDAADPLTRATWGRMVVLGDSYSSGEGGGDYGVTGSTASCHASAHAYGPAVARSLGMSDRYQVVACTGAVLADLTRPNRGHHQSPQIDAIPPDASLVTISLGGNDLDWGSTIGDCVSTRGEQELIAGSAPDCSGRLDASVAQRLGRLGPRLDRAYDELRERAPHARIVVVGYPHFFPEVPTTDMTRFGLSLIDVADQRWINRRTDDLDALIAEKAAAHGLEYVDERAALAGHELTTDDPWMWGLDTQSWHSLTPAKHDFHPTPAGQAAMARLVEQQVRSG